MEHGIRLKSTQELRELIAEAARRGCHAVWRACLQERLRRVQQTDDEPLAMCA